MAAEVVFHPAAAHRSRRSLVARDFVSNPLMGYRDPATTHEGLRPLQLMAAEVVFHPLMGYH